MVKKRYSVIDRRSGNDRRKAHNLDYFLKGGKERRSRKERRSKIERRGGWIKVGQWNSVSPWGKLKHLEKPLNKRKVL